MVTVILRLRTASILILTILLSISLPGWAKDLSADQAARHAQGRYGGQVLDVRKVKTDSGKGYRIKLLQGSGRVKLLVIDAKDGSSKDYRNKKRGKKGSGKD